MLEILEEIRKEQHNQRTLLLQTSEAEAGVIRSDNPLSGDYPVAISSVERATFFLDTSETLLPETPQRFTPVFPRDLAVANLKSIKHFNFLSG